MIREFTLPDALSLADLQVFLARAQRVDDGVVRLVGAGSILAAYVGVLHPAGLLDAGPTVLGLRTYGLAAPTAIDVVVGLGPLLERIAALQQASTDATAPVTVPLPPDSRSAAWAAISPPRSGWAPAGHADKRVLERSARAGIDEIAEAVPTGTGEQIVHRVRNEVWGRPVEGVDHVPAGGAFAALSLGFLASSGERPAVDPTVYIAGQWTRLSTDRGHVLIKRRSGSGL